MLGFYLIYLAYYIKLLTFAHKFSDTQNANPSWYMYKTQTFISIKNYKILCSPQQV